MYNGTSFSIPPPTITFEQLREQPRVIAFLASRPTPAAAVIFLKTLHPDFADELLYELHNPLLTHQVNCLIAREAMSYVHQMGLSAEETHHIAVGNLMSFGLTRGDAEVVFRCFLRNSL